MRKLLLSLGVAFLAISNTSKAQLPDKVCVGYWENWGSIQIADIPDVYNVVCLAFWEADKDLNPYNNTVNDLEFTPVVATGGAFVIRTQISEGQDDGKVYLMSIGGANGSFILNNTTDKNTFVDKTKLIIQQYGMDGIDLDFEQSMYVCNTGSHSFGSPAQHLQYLIDGIREIMSWYQSTYSKKMILTMAPEIKYTIGALSPWGETCDGAWLPVIQELSDELDLLMVQLYNAGSIYGTPPSAWSTGPAYAAGTPDFIIAGTEALIEGFESQNDALPGDYLGLPASKIAVAVPSCSAAAWSGSYSTSTIEGAINYLTGKGPKPGTRTLTKSYPDLRGIMTWSINKDVQSCGNAIGTLAPNLFDYEGTGGGTGGGGGGTGGGGGGAESINELNYQLMNFYPNPTTGTITVESNKLVGKTLFVTNIEGRVVKTNVMNSEKEIIDLSDLAEGVYYLRAENYAATVIVK